MWISPVFSSLRRGSLAGRIQFIDPLQGNFLFAAFVSQGGARSSLTLGFVIWLFQTQFKAQNLGEMASSPNSRHPPLSAGHCPLFASSLITHNPQLMPLSRNSVLFPRTILFSSRGNKGQHLEKLA